jgi:hypothetical protein
MSNLTATRCSAPVPDGLTRWPTTSNRRLAALAVVGVVSLLVASSAVGRAAGTQGVQMEATFDAGRSGTFVLTATGTGRLRSDSGKFEFAASEKRLVRNGQSVIVFTVTSTWRGQRGTLVLRERTDDVAAADGYRVGTGVWSINDARGTGQYAGVTGSGRLAYVVTPRHRVLTRWEGIVRQP